MPRKLASHLDFLWISLLGYHARGLSQGFLEKRQITDVRRKPMIYCSALIDHVESESRSLCVYSRLRCVSVCLFLNRDASCLSPAILIYQKARAGPVFVLRPSRFESVLESSESCYREVLTLCCSLDPEGTAFLRNCHDPSRRQLPSSSSVESN